MRQQHRNRYIEEVKTQDGKLSQKKAAMILALQTNTNDEAINEAMAEYCYYAEYVALAARAMYTDMLTTRRIRPTQEIDPMDICIEAAEASVSIDGDTTTISLPFCPMYSSSQMRRPSVWFERLLTELCFKNPIPYYYTDCVIEIADIYPPDTKAYCDPDNIDVRTILNVLKGRYIEDDNSRQISLYIHAEDGKKRNTEIRIYPKSTDSKQP